MERLPGSRPGRTPKEGQKAYWDADQDLYGHVLGFKGLDLAVRED